MRSGWRLGRIGGVEIRMDPSLLFVAVLLTVQFSGLDSLHVTSAPARFGYAALGAVLFFASILLHELAHAGMCRLRGIPVSGITLWMFGGATHARIESRGPLDEFLITVVGPATSVALGGVFLLAWQAGGARFGGPATHLWGELGFWNVVLGVFNLAPGFPLDGGRLLRSVVWRITGSLARATRVAARVGQVIAGALIAYGVIWTIRTENFGGLWLAILGSMLFRGASAAGVDSERRRKLEAATVADVMSPPPPTVNASVPVEEAMHRYLMGHEGEAFPVIEADRVVGFLSLSTIRGIDPSRPVREAMAGTTGTIEAAPGERLDAVAERLGDASSGTVLVVDRGRLVGVVEPEDLERYLRGGQVRRSSNGAVPPRPDVA